MANSSDHQILYGRRGTGKTHALLHLSELVERAGDIAIYLDLRTIGSAGGLYSNTALSPTQRGTQLLVDSLESIHNHLYTKALEGQLANEEAFLHGLDALVTAATEVEVVGETEQERALTGSIETEATGELALTAKGGFSATTRRKDSNTTSSRERRTGTEQHRVLFGPLSRAMQGIVAGLRPARLWLLLDEWSSVPVDLQPFLADLLRRSILPIQGVNVKIAAIEHRSKFLAPLDNDYLGIEVGSDAAPASSLDDALLFDNSRTRAEEFFAELFFNHVSPALTAMTRTAPPSRDEFLDQTFKRGSFAELVRASEGIPRDAINIAALSAQYANARQITVADVRRAAHDWYLRDKQNRIEKNGAAGHTLSFLVDEMIGRRRSRIFALPVDAQNDTIDTLYDHRLLHILRRGVVDPRKPGRLHNIFSLDYGCYASLLLDGDKVFGHADRAWSAALTGATPDGATLTKLVVDISQAATPWTSPAANEHGHRSGR